MKKIKYIALAFSMFFVFLFGKIPGASASVNDLHLVGYENIYKHDNISYLINHYSKGDDVDSFVFNYHTNLWFDNKNNNKIYFLLDGTPSNFDSDVFHIEFVLSDKDNNIIPFSSSNIHESFGIINDTENGISLKTFHSIKLVKTDYKVNNTYNYTYYDKTVSDADDGAYDYSIKFSGDLYYLDFSSFEYDKFKLESIKVEFHTDGNHPHIKTRNYKGRPLIIDGDNIIKRNEKISEKEANELKRQVLKLKSKNIRKPNRNRLRELKGRK